MQNSFTPEPKAKVLDKGIKKSKTPVEKGIVKENRHIKIDLNLT
jgi:hypothetical protein